MWRQARHKCFFASFSPTQLLSHPAARGLNIKCICTHHCVYQNYATYFLAHEQIRLLSGEAFSLCACKFCRVNSESAMTRAQLALKGNWILIGLLHVMPKTHPLLIKRIGTTLLDHALGAPTVSHVIKLAKADSDMP